MDVPPWNVRMPVDEEMSSSLGHPPSEALGETVGRLLVISAPSSSEAVLREEVPLESAQRRHQDGPGEEIWASPYSGTSSARSAAHGASSSSAEDAHVGHVGGGPHPR